MASINTAESGSGNWLTTFYYEQDLRSTHMNQILNATIKPGIYNANLALVMQDSSEAIESNASYAGMYLFVKKGSTFVFSNSYKNLYDELGNVAFPYEKDLTGIGNYLIKSVAEKDMFIPLAQVTSSGNASGHASMLLGSENTSDSDKLGEYFVVAKMTYLPKQDSQQHNPSFVCIYRNTEYSSSDTPVESETTLSEYELYFSEAGIEKPAANTTPIIDGSFSKTLIEKNDKHYISWLNIGMIREINYTSSSESVKGEYTKTIDTTGSIPRDNAIDFLKNHTFIGRGLPEYNNSFIATSNCEKPSLILDPDMKKIYINLPRTIVGSSIVSKPVDYKHIYRIGGKDPSIYTELHDFKYLGDNVNAGDLIVDVGFMYVKESLNTLDSLKLENSNDDLLSKIFSNKDVEPSFVTHQFKVNLNKDLETNLNKDLETCFNPLYDREADEYLDIDSESEFFIHKYFSTSPATLKNEIIIPLDICSANQQRLLDFVENTGFLQKIVNYLRLKNLFEANKGDKLVPLFVAFRKAARNISDTSSHYQRFEDPISTFNRINPANILSFLDIQNNVYMLPAISIDQSLFNIVSILDDSDTVDKEIV